MSSLSDFKPYKSLLLARVHSDVSLGPVVNAALDGAAGIIDDLTGYTVTERGPSRNAPPLQVGFVRYEEHRPVAWSVSNQPVDRIHHLILVARRSRHVAVYASESMLRTRMLVELSHEDGEHTGLGSLEPIEAETLNAAFVDGPTRTLWLGGTHRRTSLKPDSKILSGLNLRDALDPLDDQSYYFSAARSQLEGLAVPVGVTPRRSSVWAGNTSDWGDFRTVVAALLQRLDAIDAPVAAPLPVLAVPVAATSMQDAFDVALQPPELLADDPTIEATVREDMEKWALRSRFEVMHTAEADFTCDVYLDGDRLGSAEFSLELADPAQVRWTVTGEAAPGQADNHREALARCRRRSWVKIRYDSGHTVSDGVVFEIRFRDVAYRGFLSAVLDGFDVDREKPHDLNAIGTDSALFDWVLLKWPNIDGAQTLAGGWLACDDGAGEMADFIHLDDTADPPVVTLIHVKGAHGHGDGRGIAVTPYELVVSQAVKNLRWLDRRILAEGLAAGIGQRIDHLVWKDRVPTTRDAMLEALEAVGVDYERRVVVIQPHVRGGRVAAARSAPGTKDHSRLRHLDTLLLGADADVHALGGHLAVLIEDG